MRRPRLTVAEVYELGEFLEARTREGATISAAVEDAADKFEVSSRTAYRVWRVFRPTQLAEADLAEQERRVRALICRAWAEGLKPD